MDTMNKLMLPLVLLVCAGCHSGKVEVGNAPRSEGASKISGWKEVKTSGLALSFPSDWKAVTMELANVGKGMDSVFGTDPQYDSIKKQAAKMMENGDIKLLVYAPKRGSGFQDNCNVVVKDIPAGYDLDQIVEANKAQLPSIIAPGSKIDSSFITVPAGRVARLASHVAMANGGTFSSVQFYAMDGHRLVVITFSAGETTSSEIAKVADQAIGTLGFG